MSSPLVSIIVPVYNVEKYLSDCLDSLVNQTYQNTEIVCIDDGSTDSSPDILKSYKDRYRQIKVITTGNRGQAAARNLGLEKASGDFIMFVDSDDWINLDTINATLKVEFFNDVNVDFICFGLQRVYPDISVPHKVYSTESILTVNKSFGLKLSPEPVAKLYRSSFLRENKIMFPEGLWYEDMTFYWHCFSCANQVGTMKEVFYNYRQRNDSTMGMSLQKKPGMAIHHLYNLEVIYKIWSENNYLVSHRDFFEHIFERYVQQSMKFLCSEDKAEFVAKLKTLLIDFGIQPKRFSLIFDLIHNKRIVPIKYKWAQSIRKKLMKLKK